MKVTRKDVKIAVRKYQILMGMKDWDIEVSFAIDSDNHGECRANPWNKKAKLSFNLDTMTTMKHMDGTVRHEMFHVFLWPLKELAMDLTGGDNSPGAAVIEKVEESVVDAFEKWPMWKGME